MWVARVLERSDEYLRRSTCLRLQGSNSKKLSLVPLSMDGMCHAIGLPIEAAKAILARYESVSFRAGTF